MLATEMPNWSWASSSPVNPPTPSVIFRWPAAVLAADRNGDGDAGDGGETTAPSTVTATVVEPVMLFDKAILSAATGLDAGDTVQYRITFSNTGGSTAHDLLLADTLPAGLTIQSIGPVTVAGGSTVDTAVSGVGTGSLSGEFTVPVGGSVTVDYKAILGNTVTPGTNYTNDAVISWTSLDGVDSEERTGVEFAPA